MDITGSQLIQASITILVGVAVFVFGQFILKVVIEPLQDFRKHISLIAFHLDYYANIYTNNPDWRDEGFTEARKYLREDASILTSKRGLVYPYGLFKLTGLVPAEEDVKSAAGNLYAIPHYSKEPLNADKAKEDIQKALGIKPLNHTKSGQSTNFGPNQLNSLFLFSLIFAISSYLFIYQYNTAIEQQMKHIFIPDFEPTSLLHRIAGVFFHNGLEHYIQNMSSVVFIMIAIILFPEIFNELKARTLSFVFFFAVLVTAIVAIFVDPWPSTGISEGISAIMGFFLVIFSAYYYKKLKEGYRFLKRPLDVILLKESLKITFYLIAILFIPVVNQIGGDFLGVLSGADNKYGKIGHIISYLIGVVLGLYYSQKKPKT
jgi:hypothetical protein